MIVKNKIIELYEEFYSDSVTLMKKLKNLSSQELKELTFIMYKAANNQKPKNFDALTDEEKEKEVIRYCMCEIPESTQKKAMAKFWYARNYLDIQEVE